MYKNTQNIFKTVYKTHQNKQQSKNITLRPENVFLVGRCYVFLYAHTYIYIYICIYMYMTPEHRPQTAF